MPVPKNVAKELSDEIVDILLKRDMIRHLSEFEVRRAQTLINELAKVHPLFAHSLRGALLAVRRTQEAQCEKIQKHPFLPPVRLQLSYHL
jgi:hypothetical protein